jgi:hypothetical protein
MLERGARCRRARPRTCGESSLPAPIGRPSHVRRDRAAAPHPDAPFATPPRNQEAALVGMVAGHPPQSCCSGLTLPRRLMPSHQLRGRQLDLKQDEELTRPRRLHAEIRTLLLAPFRPLSAGFRHRSWSAPSGVPARSLLIPPARSAGRERCASAGLAWSGAQPDGRARIAQIFLPRRAAGFGPRTASAQRARAADRTRRFPSDRRRDRAAGTTAAGGEHGGLGALGAHHNHLRMAGAA